MSALKAVKETVIAGLAMFGLASIGAGIHWTFVPVSLETIDASKRNIELVTPSPVEVTPAETDDPADMTEPTDETEAVAAEPAVVTDWVAWAQALPVEIGTDEADKLGLNLAALYVDARAPDAFAEGHVLGAFNVPADDPELYLGDLLGFDPSQIFVIYCSGGECNESKIVADRLGDLGYVNLFIDVDGYPAWVDAGLPVGVVETGGGQ
ncbi:MAG: rhodanese-like domain-containing protein [Planctomycetota bacterium]